MRRTPNPAITTQMYRHFATVTVALTALVAFLADGERPSAAEAPVHVAKAAKAEDSSVEASERAVTPDPGAWGSDSDSDFGQPTMSASGAGSWFANPFASGGNAQPGAGVTLNPQNTDGEGDQGDPAKPSAGAPAPTAAQITAAMAASRLRSGAAGGD